MDRIKKLFIAEKPSVAKEFAKVLKSSFSSYNGYMESSDYVVTWCVGHLVTMSYPEVYDEKLKFWNLSSLPFIPSEFKYEVIEAVKGQFNIVSKLLTREDIEEIYVCTDSGREGEYIYRLVDMMAGVKGKIKKRVWIDSQTEQAILDGIKQARDLSTYNNLASSAFLRAKEDYLMGINFSRLLSVVFGKQVAKSLEEQKVVISIGRVMTCVLGMIVARHREIVNFEKVTYYKLDGLFNDSFHADFKIRESSLYFGRKNIYSDTGFLLKQDAQECTNYLLENKETSYIKEMTKKKQKENAPLLYNLAELQNECSKRFKISPDETLNVAQSLYEKKLLTYPRTDARVLSSAVAKEISKNLNGLFKSHQNDTIKQVLNMMKVDKVKTDLSKTKYVNDLKITDHYALIPTGSGLENYTRLTELERNVYDMVVFRFLAIFFDPAEFNKVNLEIDIKGETFICSGKVCLKKGYLQVVELEKMNFNTLKEKKDEEEENSFDVIENLKKGSKVVLNEVCIKEAETSPPSKFNSGSIILAMENAGKLIEDEILREQIKSAGIGTSATRAEIIKKLEKIGYIDLNAKTQILSPTKKGEAVYDVVKKSMPDLLNPDLTASWEKGLGMVANGEITEQEFSNKLKEYIHKKVNNFKKGW